MTDFTIADATREMLAKTEFSVVAGAEETQVECADCGGMGFVRHEVKYDHPDFGKLFPCPNPNCPARKQQNQERYQKITARAALPPEYAEMTFANWEGLIKAKPESMLGKWDALGAAKAFVSARDRRFYFDFADSTREANLLVQAAKQTAPANRKHFYDFSLEFDPDWSVGEKNSIVFAGMNGIGKTSLAASITAALAAYEVPVMYVRTADVLAAIRERYEKQQKFHPEYEFDWGETDQAIVATFQQAPVLILDEFGLQQFSDHAVDRTEQIVRYRYSHQMPTIFTTNLGYEELAADYKWRKAVGHAVHGMAHWFVMSGAELRRRNGAFQSR